MNVIEQIHAHRSIRAFRDEPVAKDTLMTILDAAVRASTGGSMQLYSMIVTTDRARRETLAAIHLGQDAIRHAPVTLTFCVDTHRIARWLKLHREHPGLDHMWGFALGFSDALLAAQNALLAAESLGLGGCFLGSTFVSAPMLVGFFECPPGVLPVATLSLGHPAESPAIGTRLPVQAMLHEEKYSDIADGELEAAYAEHAAATLQRFLEVPAVGAGARANGIDHFASYVGRYQYAGELMEIAAAYFMGAVQNQGFCRDDQVARIRAVRTGFVTPEIAALHPMRQLVFAMALVSGHADHLLGRSAAEQDKAITAFFTERDPSLMDDVMSRGLFDLAVRSRLSACIAELGGKPQA